MSTDANPTVIVVESPEQVDPPAPEYVTRGELNATVALLREQFGHQVQDVAETAQEAAVDAFVARSEAEDAQTTAEVAAVIAVEAVEAATEAVEEPEEPEADDDTAGGPKPAQPREEQPAVAAPARRQGYGARSIYG